MPRPRTTEQVPEVQAPEAEGLLAVLVQRAYEFRAEKDELYKRIQANRRSLRDLDSQGALTDEQSEWLRQFYTPRAMNGSDDL